MGARYQVCINFAIFYVFLTRVGQINFSLFDGVLLVVDKSKQSYFEKNGQKMFCMAILH